MEILVVITAVAGKNLFRSDTKGAFVMDVAVQEVLDREGKATVTKSVRMALARRRDLFEKFKALVGESSLEECLTEAIQLLVDKHTSE